MNLKLTQPDKQWLHQQDYMPGKHLMILLLLKPYPKITRTKREEKKVEFNVDMADCVVEDTYPFTDGTQISLIIGFTNNELSRWRWNTTSFTSKERIHCSKHIVRGIIWQSFTGRFSSSNILAADQLISDPSNKSYFALKIESLEILLPLVQSCIDTLGNTSIILSWSKP